MKLRILMTLGCCMAATALADDPKTAFDVGNYAEAAKQLEPKLAAEPSAEGYYNLGLAREKAGDATQAAFDYERALWLDPGLKPAANAFAKLAAAQKISLPPHTWRDDVHAVAHPETVLFASQAQRRRGAWSALAMFGVLAGMVLAAAGWLTDVRLFSGRPAMVNAKDGADVLTEPANNSSPILSLPAGSPVSVISPRGSWAYVDLAGGAKGWVQTEKLTPLVPGETL
jgi:hypothetical protein